MDVCLIYFSTAVNLFQEEELQRLLSQSRRNNPPLGITGLLLYVRGHIIQILEGEKQAVETLYQRIEQDPRHTDISLVINRPIYQRLFPNWAMGYETITERQLEEIRAIVQLDRSEGARLVFSDDPVLRTLQAFYDGNRHNDAWYLTNRR